MRDSKWRIVKTASKHDSEVPTFNVQQRLYFFFWVNAGQWSTYDVAFADLQLQRKRQINQNALLKREIVYETD
jgi:hypothetical protein